MKKFILATILVLIVLFVGGLFYLGVFYKVTVAENEFGPLKMVYKEFKGDYSKVGPVMTEVYDSLKNSGIETEKGIGIYYDDPKKVAKEELRSEVGSIIDEKDYDKLSKISADLKIKDIEKNQRIVAEFPYKNMMSIFVGIYKVYPAISKYIEEKGYQPSQSMEVYDIASGKIIYVMDIKK